MAERYFRTHPAAVDDQNNGVFVIWRADSTGGFTINETGENVWRRLRTAVSLRQISAEMAEASGADERVIRDDMEKLIGSLHHAGLVESVPHAVATDTRLTVPSAREKMAALQFIGSAITPAFSLAIPPASGGGFWEAVARFAFRYRVSGLLQYQLERNNQNRILPEWLCDQLRSLQQINREQNRVVRRQLNEVVAALNRNGIEPLLLKGAAMLLSDTYGGDGSRWMSDIDLLLPAEELERGAATLADLGFRRGGNAKPDWSSHHHLAPLLRFEGEFPIELHREPLRSGFSGILPAFAVWRGSVPMQHTTLRFRVPSPVHRVIHAIAHSQLVDGNFARGALPLRELCDFAWLMLRHRDEIDVSELTTTFALHADALEGFLHASERLLAVQQPSGRQPGLAARVYWWRVRGGIRWEHIKLWNERIYRLSAGHLRKHTGSGQGRHSLFRARTRHLARSLSRKISERRGFQ